MRHPIRLLFAPLVAAGALWSGVAATPASAQCAT